MPIISYVYTCKQSRWLFIKVYIYTNKKIYITCDGFVCMLLCILLCVLLIWHRNCRQLGSGEFGVVAYGKWTPSPDKEAEVAIKTLNSDASDKDRLRFIQEAAIMCQFDHENVIKLYGVVTETPRMIVLEYMSRGDLRNLLLQIKSLLAILSCIS